MMKKLIGFLFASVAVLLLSVSCRHKMEHGEVRGLIDEMNDSAMVVKIDGSKVKFDITVASFTHGAVMYGDSVIVYYIGDLSMKRALAESVYLIDRPSRIIEIPRNPEKRDTTAEMITRPADPERDAELQRNSERMVRAAQKYAK